MDFGTLPPEVNSTRIFAGPGTESLAVAAAGWAKLANGLLDSAEALVGLVSGLSEHWQGPSSETMVAKMHHYVAQLINTSRIAKAAWVQANAAVRAYETARAAVVHPAIVATNRTQLAVSVNTNVLGQNTPLIAQLEAAYSEFWARDSAAMYAYAASSASVLSGLQSFADETFQSFLGSGPWALATDVLSISALWGMATGATSMSKATVNVPAALGELVNPGGGLAVSAQGGAGSMAVGGLSVPQGWGYPQGATLARIDRLNSPNVSTDYSPETGAAFPMIAPGGAKQQENQRKPTPEYGFVSTVLPEGRF